VAADLVSSRSYRKFDFSSFAILARLNARGSVNVTPETWPRRHRLTVEEYYQMAEVGLLAPDARVELIDGEIVDMAPIGSRHAAAVSLLAERLIRGVGEAAIVWIQSPVRLDARSEPQPDLALLHPRGDRYAGGHPGPADVLLLIEVSDATLRYDREIKTGLYARHGVPEVWVVDLPNGRLHVLREPREGGYADRSTIGAHSVPVDALSVDVDLSGLF
jgi:Uma2 family endonuclease